MNIVEKILETVPGNIVTDNEIKIILKGSTDDQRYGIIKRALASNKLLRIKRGLYCLNERFHKRKLNLFELADRIYGPSYISFYSALSYHGWIPEAVYTVTSACVKRSRTFSTPLGVFSYLRVPANYALFDVRRNSLNSEFFYVASPWKALMDFIYVYKKDWTGIEPLVNNLRIEKEYLKNVSFDYLEELAGKYNSKIVYRFIKGLEEDLRNEH